MKYLYYPGCSLHSTAVEYGDSFKRICKQLDIELKEIDNWVCCGTTPAHSSSKFLSVTLPIFNLKLAEKDNIDNLLVPCSSCYSRFRTAVFEMENDKELGKKVEYILDSKFDNKIKIKHPLEVFSNDNELKKTEGKIKKKLDGMKIACYYGCLLTRPPEVTNFDSTEYPMTMDKILRNLGADTIDWSYKTDCCGASLALTKSDIVKKMSKDILENARDSGAEAIVAACPLCQSNLDLWQKPIEIEYKQHLSLPVFYFSQMIGLALGISSMDLGLSKLMVSPFELLKQKGVIRV